MKYGLLVAFIVLVADQATKWLALAELVDRSVLLIPGFFDLVLTHNLGAAFSLFADLPADWRIGFLVGVALVAMGIILSLLRGSPGWLPASGLGMILGGAIGNLIDRVRWGWVVDFIHVHWYDHSFPIFNVADSAITVGVGLLLLDNYLQSSRGQDV